MYENSRFLKNRFTFCDVNTNFGQQWAPPAYYHLTPIVSKGKHWNRVSAVRHIQCFINWDYYSIVVSDYNQHMKLIYWNSVIDLWIN